MKRFLVPALAFGLLCLAARAQASPYLVCSPDSGATSYSVQGLPDSVPASNVAPDPSGAYGLKLDLADLPAGSYTVTVTACVNDSTWGQVCSNSSNPFSFTRPSPPSSPTGTGLSPR